MSCRITTAAERAKLKPGTICMDDGGNAWKRGSGSWVGTGEGGPLWDDMDLPMTVLHEPNVKGNTPLGLIRELRKHLDHWEKQEHTSVTIAYLRRHFKDVR